MKIYKYHVDRYLRLFGLTEYEPHFEVLPPDSDSEAEMEADTQNCLVTFYIAKKLQRSQKSLAKHETLHLLLADLTSLCQQRFITPRQLDKAEEAIVRKLEKLI